jgi:hypothetical protein
MRIAASLITALLLPSYMLHSVKAAFIVEADNVAPAGKAFDHFVSTPAGTGFQLSVTPSTALGLAGNQSAFGNPANSTGPDRYELFYTPGVDVDNTSFVAGTVLGNSSASDNDGAGPLLPDYTIAPVNATGLSGGASGLYHVYFTVPSTINVNPAGSTISIGNSSSDVVLNPVRMNNGDTGPDEVAGGSYTGGANNRWLRIGTVPLVAGNTYSVVIEANASPPDSVSQRTHGVMWEKAVPMESTIPGFQGYYDPANWTTTTNGNGGVVNTSGAPYFIELHSPDDGGGFGFIDYTIIAPADGVFSFDWHYQSYDVDGDGFDSSWYINDSVFFLSGTSGSSGTISALVSAGDVIGWRMEASDSIEGPAVLTVGNFSAPVPIPEPASLLLPVIGLSASSAFARRNRTTLRNRRVASALPSLLLSICHNEAHVACSPSE